MENVYAGVIRHDRLSVLKSCQQEIVKSIVCHVVVLDFSGAAFVVYIIRRVCDDQIRLAVIHKNGESFCFSAVSTNQPMSTECPYVAELGDRRLLELLIDIKIVIVQTILDAAFE